MDHTSLGEDVAGRGLLGAWDSEMGQSMSLERAAERVNEAEMLDG